MKLLLDENISPRLADSLADLFPASLHIHALGLAQANDTTIWQYAGQHGYAVLSKDSDFYHASMIRGHPPKLIWVRLGNCSTSDIEKALRNCHQELFLFDASAQESAFLLI